LEKILKGRNIGMARSAREALEKIVTDENTTRRVAQAAMQTLKSTGTLIPQSKESARPPARRTAKQNQQNKGATWAKVVIK
jgi:hypothetical protein